MRKGRIPTVLMVPGLCILVLGFFVPLILLFQLSWYQGAPGSGLVTKALTTGNYTRLLGDVYYLKIFARTFRIALYATLLSFVLGYPMAIMLARSKGKAKTLLFAVVLTPLLTNVVARTLGLMLLLGRHGPINNLLALLGGFRVTLVPNVPGIVIGLTQVFMPYFVLSVSSVLQNIDDSLVEAARSLGSSRFRAFWKVVFPLSLPGVVAGSLFVFLLSFSAFVTPRILGGGKIMVMTTLIYQQAMLILDWPFTAAIGFVLLLISLVLVTMYTRALSGTERRKVVPQGHRRCACWSRAIRLAQDWYYDRTAAVGQRWGSFVRRWEGMRLSLHSVGLVTRIGGWTLKALIIAFILAPLPIVIICSFSGSSLITFPPRGGFSMQWYAGLLNRPEYIRSFLLSLQIALTCVVIGVSTGTLAALGLVRYRFPGKEVVRSLFLSPLMVPAVIVGIALLRFLAMMGWSATFGGVLLGHMVLVSAYVTRTVSASLVGFDRSLEEAAHDLGAGAIYTFRRVTLPLIKPGLIAGAVFAFLVSFDETTVSVFTTGPGTITLPVRLFSQLEYGVDPTITAISGLMIVLAVLVLLLIDRVLGLEKFSGMR